MLKRIKIWVKVLYCLIYTFIPSKSNMLNANETIELLKQEKKSFIRFGDGEFNILLGKDIHYQKYSKSLEREMRAIIDEYDDNAQYFIGMPKYYLEISGLKLCKSRLNASSWAFSRYYFKKFINKKKIYGDSFLFIRDNKDLYSRLWGEYKNIIFIHSNIRCYQDFKRSYKFDTYYIPIPSKNSFETIDKLEEKIKEVIKGNNLNCENTCVLISAGPTAKVLTHRISKNMVVFDTGHCWDEPLKIK